VSEPTHFVDYASLHSAGVSPERIKKSFPDLKIVLKMQAGDLKSAIGLLKRGEIDRIERGEKSYWKDDEGIIHWSKEASSLENKNGKILLVMMPAWNNDYAPYGLAHISAALKDAGHAVKSLDLNWKFWQYAKKHLKNPATFQDIAFWNEPEKYNIETQPHLNGIFETLKSEILSGEYSYVGFSLFDANLLASIEAFRFIRKLNPNIKIFAGGPGCTSRSPFYVERHLKNNLLDAAVFGEGEVSVVKLLEKWKNNASEEVLGTWIREASGSIQKAPVRPLADINTLPFPDFSDFPIYNYDFWMMPIYFSRGCVAKCSFCAETKYWVRFRILKTEKLIEMIKRTTEEYGISNFRFSDSLLNGSHKHLEKFVDSVAEQKVSMTFSGFCRLESDLNAGLLEKMARAGCQSISFGLESASQTVTDLMNKEVDVRNYERIIKDTAAAGIRVTCCVMIGFPGERWRDFFQTAKTLVKLRSDIYILNMNIMSPAPQVATDPEEMKRLGIDEKNIDIFEWQTKDGKNTPTVRYIRLWLLMKLWALVQVQGGRQRNWYYISKKRSSSQKKNMSVPERKFALESQR
jgi:anaerobic magnesium-protoporphyrin IX monomethyl ester cyclase